MILCLRKVTYAAFFLLHFARLLASTISKAKCWNWLCPRSEVNQASLTGNCVEWSLYWVIFFWNFEVIISKVWTFSFSLISSYRHQVELVRFLNQFADPQMDMPPGWDKKVDQSGRVSCYWFSFSNPCWKDFWPLMRSTINFPKQGSVQPIKIQSRSVQLVRSAGKQMRAECALLRVWLTENVAGLIFKSITERVKTEPTKWGSS